MLDEALTADRLARRTLELVDIPSESRSEAALAEHVAAVVPRGRLGLVHREEETLVYATQRRDRPLVLLAGHLDTVPAQGNIPGRLENGAVHGLGASDMKGGLAVMIELARWVEESGTDLDVDLALLFFPREELPPAESAVPAFFAAGTDAGRADLVIVLEPTDNTIQAGCLGVVNAELVFAGESAHSARPWMGVNAVDVAVAALAPRLPFPRLDVEIAGLTFVEVLSATQIHGGIAANVIPDRVAVHLNFRYAPDRTPADAEARLAELVGDAGELTIFSNSAPARVAADSPLVERLRAVGGFALEPKQAWTPVAEFAAEGLDAINLGPGATRFAHRRDERIEVAELVRTFEALRRFVTGSV
jgi:succinyl-diaminopimelate desuccinylase